MMGAAAVAVVVVCAVMYTIFEVIERRKRKKFAEDGSGRKNRQRTGLLHWRPPPDPR